MYKIISLIALFCGQSVLAQDCVDSATPLHADYVITTTAAKGAEVKQLSLWRAKDVVAHQYPQTQITETWEHIHKKLIKPTRYFDEHARAIEYQPGEKVHGKTETDWSYRNQLFSDALIANMQKVSEQGEGCEKEETYQLTKHNAVWTLVWQPALKLAKSFKAETKNKTVRWERTAMSFDKTSVKAFFAKRSDYQSTDFADIGDDHTDPFLTRMVHLGFIEKGASGMYDSDGKAIGEGHHH